MYLYYSKKICLKIINILTNYCNTWFCIDIYNNISKCLIYSSTIDESLNTPVQKQFSLFANKRILVLKEFVRFE